MPRSRRPNTRETMPLEMRITNYANPSNPKYLPTFPVVWDETDVNTFVKGYFVFFSDYIEPHDGFEPLLSYEHVGLYLDLYYAGVHGEAFRFADLAVRRRMDPKTLRGMLDRLEDVELIHREMCKNMQGRPIDIVVHTPLSTRKLRSGERERLNQRLIDKHTAMCRRELGQQWPGRVRDLPAMLAAIKGKGQYRLLRKLFNIVTWLGNQHRADDSYTQTKFVDDVKRLCIHEQIGYNDKLLRTALLMWRAGMA